jgi:hypothetical protein
MENPAPVAVIDDIATFELPVFVIVMFCAADLLPVLTVPKFKLVGFTDSTRLAVVPAPVNATLAGESGELLVIVNVPVALPAVVGANFTLKLLVAPAASVNGKVATPVRLNPVPVAAIWVTFRFAVPVFLSCTVCVFAAPSETLPKLTLVGVMLNCGVPVGGGTVTLFEVTPAQPYCIAGMIANPASKSMRLTKFVLKECAAWLIFTLFCFTLIVEASHFVCLTPE